MTDPIEPCCPFDTSAYSGTPDTRPCEKTVDIPRIIAELDGIYARGEEQKALAHLELWRDRARECGDWRGELALQSELMGYHRRDNDREGAFAAIDRGLELIREHRMAQTVSGATVQLNAATTMKAFGLAAESLELFREVLRVYSNRLDAADYRFGGLYNNMALSYADTGEYETAEQFYFRALNVIKQCAQPENELAVTWCNLAELYSLLGSEEKLEKALDTAWELLNSPKLIHDGYHAFTILKCAPTFDRFGFFVYSVKLKERAARIYEGT